MQILEHRDGAAVHRYRAAALGGGGGAPPPRRMAERRSPAAPPFPRPEVGDFETGDVLIENGVIAAVGASLDAGDAEVIDVTDRIVLPGLIDTHRHTWQALFRNIGSDWTLAHYFTGLHGTMSQLYRPEDTYAGNLIGTLEALDGGITTLLDWSHNLNTPEHSDAAIAVLQETRSRVVVGQRVAVHVGLRLVEKTALLELCDRPPLAPFAVPGVAGDADVELAREQVVALGHLERRELVPARRHGERDELVVRGEVLVRDPADVLVVRQRARPAPSARTRSRARRPRASASPGAPRSRRRSAPAC